MAFKPSFCGFKHITMTSAHRLQIRELLRFDPLSLRTTACRKRLTRTHSAKAMECNKPPYLQWVFPCRVINEIASFAVEMAAGLQIKAKAELPPGLFPFCHIPDRSLT